MKGMRRAPQRVFTLLLTALLWLYPAYQASASTPEKLVPLGSTVGIELKLDGVMIVGLSQVDTGSGEVQPALDAGLTPGDVITAVGGREVKSAGDFLTAVSQLDGGAVEVTVQREGKTVRFNVMPAKNSDGGYQLGLWLRDGVSGIGTLTYYDPGSESYGALGHGINDVDTGELIPVHRGEIMSAEVVDVVKGTGGTPGELCGRIDGENILGNIALNTDCGVFGSLEHGTQGEELPIASESEIVLGRASILSNIAGSEVKEYEIEICRVYRNTSDSRSVMIAVTDPELLEATGGIVQGMSGSPILQNGKIIGAVTHVLVNDPTRGYGVSIEKMLKTVDNAA